jgi:ribosome-associated protein
LLPCLGGREKPDPTSLHSKLIKGAFYLTSLEIVKKAAEILNSKKAEDIKAIEILGISVIGDYFLLASGTSTTQVKALADEVDFKLSELGITPLRTEGAQSATWIILDYGDIIIHIFHKETREFFNLERLWADGKTIGINELVAQV